MSYENITEITKTRVNEPQIETQEKTDCIVSFS